MPSLRSIRSVLLTSLLLACSSTSSGTGDPSQAGATGETADRKHSGGSDSGTDAGNRTDAGGDASEPSGDAASDGSSPDKITTVFTILMENHDYNEIVGSPNAPYFNSLIAAYGLATNYMDSGTHPSLPNYLTMASGATQYPGGVDLDPTTSPFPKTADNLGTQLQAKGIAWRAYEENMGTPCKLAASGNYAPKHDPFLYFTDMQTGANGLCARTNVDYSELPADLAAGTYRYMWLTPNLIDDGHNPSTNPVTALKASDAWAKVAIGKIMESPAYLNGGVIFLTWDEAEGRNGNSNDQIPMIIISPRIKSPGFKSAKAYSHKSYLATVEDILGLPRLATVKNEPSMMEFFR